MNARRLASIPLASLLALIADAAIGSAQRVELPTPAGPRTIVGVVTDAERRPLEDVEVGSAS